MRLVLLLIVIILCTFSLRPHRVIDCLKIYGDWSYFYDPGEDLPIIYGIKKGISELADLFE
jgi:hypothetical protein